MLKFYWRMLLGGESPSSSRASAALREETSRPELPAQLAFCRVAEELGIAGLLVDIGAGKPDPIVLSSALGAGSTFRVTLPAAAAPATQPVST